MKKYLISAIVGIVLLFVLSVIMASLKVKGYIPYMIIAATTITAIKFTYEHFKSKESGYTIDYNEAEHTKNIDRQTTTKEDSKAHEVISERAAMIVANVLTGIVVVLMVYALFTQF